MKVSDLRLFAKQLSSDLNSLLIASSVLSSHIYFPRYCPFQGFTDINQFRTLVFLQKTAVIKVGSPFCIFR